MAIYKKQALVIGNESYVRRPLAAYVNDATDLSHCRRSIGFQTRCEINLHLNFMEAISRQFIQSIQSGSIVMFDFSSHGIQYDGINYLSSIDNSAYGAGHLDQDGLAPMKAPPATIIAYACEADQRSAAISRNKRNNMSRGQWKN